MFRSINLEMSLKPFKKTDDAYIRRVCAEVFETWAPLLHGREEISIMLWTGDGSEIIDYTGDMDRPFEWAYFLGTANNPPLGDMPCETSLHERKQLYIENPPVITYRIMRRIVAALKEAGSAAFPQARMLVGATFDIGPEFAISDFKYSRHPESCRGTGCDSFGMVDPTALLNADDYPYAAYPGGLPEGTPVGTLLGAQANIYLRDMGFDYIWLSNGMGFTYEPWNPRGAIFDGEKFYAEKLADTREKVFLFWKLFREQCPDFQIRTRGTNYSVGMDYASDGVPLYDIYNAGFNITPPPNSPWAALNDDFGIEILGQLTRNCELPGRDYMFRYYLHDSWWMNSPWYDRYESNPHDIYLPMALSRIDESGRTQSPGMFHILEIDNSMGGMPPQCAYETIPHFLKAEKEAPDEPAPLALIYPMREYTCAGDEESLREIYCGDTFIKDAINRGLPLASVASTDSFAVHDLSIYKKSILIVPAHFDNAAVKRKLADYRAAGGRIIAYGGTDALAQADFASVKVDIGASADLLIEAVTKYGYDISCEGGRKPVITLHRYNNAIMLALYNRDTSAEFRMRMPLGAPVILGFDTRFEDGYATYHFHRSLRGECRVFVKQSGGCVRAREMAPVNRKYRRKIRITGLDDAEVFLFGESYCSDRCVVARLPDNDATVVPEPGWEAVRDPENGTYLHKKHVSGDITFCMPFRDRV